VPGDDHALGVDQDRDLEAEGLDALGDGVNGGVADGAGVAVVFLDRVDG